MPRRRGAWWATRISIWNISISLFWDRKRFPRYFEGYPIWWRRRWWLSILWWRSYRIGGHCIFMPFILGERGRNHLLSSFRRGDQSLFSSTKLFLELLDVFDSNRDPLINTLAKGTLRGEESLRYELPNILVLVLSSSLQVLSSLYGQELLQLQWWLLWDSWHRQPQGRRHVHLLRPIPIRARKSNRRTWSRHFLAEVSHALME